MEEPGVVNWHKLLAHPKRERLIESLRRQLAKDLPIPVEEIPVGDLYAFLVDWVEALVNQPELLNELCYRVDVREGPGLPAKADVTPEALSLAILEREAQKVIFREQYAGRL